MAARLITVGTSVNKEMWVKLSTKGGMDAMTRALARGLGGRRIRVNSVAPGYLQTEMTV